MLSRIYGSVCVLVLCLSPTPVYAADVLREFWSYDEYLNTFPEQQLLVNDLKEKVFGTAEPLNIKQARPISIELLQPANQISTYWKRNQLAFELRLQELGIQYDLNVVQTKPNQEHRLQIEALTNALNKKPDYLIFTLYTSKHQELIERAIATTETKVILQNITSPIKAWGEKQPFLYVGFDHESGARILADYFRSTLPKSSKYGVLYYSPGYLSDARGDSFIYNMSHLDNYQLRSAYYTDANFDSGYIAAKRMLRANQDLAMIYACSTDVALGAQQAIKELNRTEVKINGWGGGDNELVSISEGGLDVTVMRMNDDTGIAMAEAVKLDLLHKPVPTVFTGDFELVIKSDSESKIDALKLRAFRYSGKP